MRSAIRIFVFTALFSKRYESNRNMPKFIDEFKISFAVLEEMGDEARISDKLKAPILLDSLGTKSELEPTIAELRM